MTHIGIVCPPLSSHINCMAALGQELKQRGHKITVFQISDVESQVASESLDFHVIGESDHPPGSVASFLGQMGKLDGLSAMKFAFNTVRKANTMFFRDLPKAFKEAGVEIALIDQGEPACGTVAEFLGIPFISICCGLPLNREADIPPYFTTWDYQTHPNWWIRLRNQAGFFVFDWLTRSVAKDIAQQRKKWNLPHYHSPDNTFSTLAQISQFTPDFDFPRKALPACFHYTGPFRLTSAQPIAFPYEQLTGQPLIYASMGTIQNRQSNIFQCIAESCQGIDVQLVISLGNGGRVEDYLKLPGEPIVVKYAPQLELLSRASLAITHGGNNTVFESLSHGVPMVAIPLTNDQPGTAARIKWTETGEVIPVTQLNRQKLRDSIQRVLQGTSYRINAARLRKSIHQSGGVLIAADIVEQAIATDQPVVVKSDKQLQRK